MIRLKVKEWCEEKGVLYNNNLVDTGYRLKLAVNLNSPTAANQLWKSDMRKIGLDTIEDLCRALGCTPNDLFEFDPPLAQSLPAVKLTIPAKRKPQRRKAIKTSPPKKSFKLRLA